MKMKDLKNGDDFVLSKNIPEAETDDQSIDVCKMVSISDEAGNNVQHGFLLLSLGHVTILNDKLAEMDVVLLHAH